MLYCKRFTAIKWVHSSKQEHVLLQKLVWYFAWYFDDIDQLGVLRVLETWQKMEGGLNDTGYCPNGKKRFLCRPLHSDRWEPAGRIRSLDSGPLPTSGRCSVFLPPNLQNRISWNTECLFLATKGYHATRWDYAGKTAAARNLPLHPHLPWREPACSWTT